MKNILIALFCIVVIAIASYGTLYYAGYIDQWFGSGMTYVGISYSSNLQTGSFIVDYAPQITIEQYRIKRLPDFSRYNYNVKESQRNTFAEKLQQYNINLTIHQIVVITNNETGQIIFSRIFNFTSGSDRKIEIYFDNSALPLGTVLRIEINVSISVTCTMFTWQKQFEKTFYTQVKEGNTIDKPEVTLTGKLVEKTHPGMIQITVVALEVDKNSWIEPVPNLWLSDTTKIYVYLSLKTASLADMGLQIGDMVAVSGQLSKDAQGILWLEVSSIRKADAIIQ